MNKKQNLNDLTNEIIDVTSKIKEHFPELYILLIETPLFHYHNNNSMKRIDSQQYLSALKTELIDFERCE